jgi:alpha-L-rhamnosidase
MPRAPVALRCEQLENPLGLDVSNPRLSWQLPSSRRGTVQTAYRIVVADSADALASQRHVLADTGRVRSSESHLTSCPLADLQPMRRYWWAVQVWDETGKVSPWSEPAWWETGLMEQPWTAGWIGLNRGEDQQPNPPRYLRRSFQLGAKPTRARLYATARGLFEPWINGQRVGADRLTPGYTDYRKRLEYLVYDVTAALQAGPNAIGSILADGWYAGHFGFLGKRHNYGPQPAFSALLRVEMEDGSVEEVITDHHWQVATGEIQLADLYDGEERDARRALLGWNEAKLPRGTARRFAPADVFEFPVVPLSAKATPPIRATAERPAEAITEPSKGRYIFDFGQNLVGVARLRVKAASGTRLILRFGEMLQADGSLYTANLRRARCTDAYVCAGNGEEVFEPVFTFHGFRYVEVTGFDRRPALSALTGIVLNSDLPWIGGFECSEPLVNRLQSAIQWGQRGNFLDAPTDCPQRDERLGWTGDAQVFIGTACSNMAAGPFFAKWLRDLEDAQAPNGAYPDVAPDQFDLSFPVGTPPHPHHRGNAGWADAGVICPWVVYQHYGDKRTLEERYAGMRRWIRFQEEESRGLLRPATVYGDWLATDAVTPQRAPTPRDLIGTAYFAKTTELTAQAAVILGRDLEAKQLRRLHGRIVKAFQREYLTPAGRLAGDTQTAYLMALAFDLLPERLRSRAVERLVQLIEEAGNHLTTGFLGTPLLCPTLTRFGRHDVACRLLLQKTYPSWLFPVINGATTMWERWNSWTPDKGFGEVGMNSFNHYAYGAVGEWLYESVAGLAYADGGAAGRRLRLEPRLGEGLTAAGAWRDTPYGRAESRWKITRRGLEWRVTVPANTTATALIPGAELVKQVTEGGHPLKKAGGVSIVGPEPGGLRCELVAGRYRFMART